MKINVTKKDIQNGKRCNGIKCPVALAISRKINKKAEVGSVAIYISGKPIMMPKKVRDFIGKFDSQNKAKPFSFNLEIE